ncbi:MAG: tyrosine--tRNA ligase [Candidatus Moraniibacteriota bacterium]
MNTDAQAIDEVLNRGTIVSILPDKDAFRMKLLAGEKLRFYIGFDATAPTLHLSHAKNIMLLEKFRKLGHEAIVLFGDFTARIGDPTGEKSARKQLTREEILKNVEAWRLLIRPLMDFDAKENPPQIKFNHDWLSKMSFEDVISLASNFTVQQMLERDMFEKRIEAGEPVHLHEFLYPLMQGYDSVAMGVDVELCGTDQTFNALAGRTLLKKLKGKEKFVVTLTLMENPVTGELMSKSKGTGIFLDATANEKFGQVMVQSDEMTKVLLVNCTLLPLPEIDEIMTAENPRDAKLRLAKEIVTIYHGEEEAEKAERYFIDTFSKKQIPDDIDEVSVAEGEKLLDVIVRAGFAESKGDARRKIEQGGVEIDGERIVDFNAIIVASQNDKVLKVGKKDFVKIVFH